MIVLATDFGLAGPYTGQVKAVLHQLAPGVRVIDLFADLPAANPKPAAYLLAAYGSWFPAGTVLLAVIDPGVGSSRAAIVVEADGRFYVGPDNGLFELVMRRAGTARGSEIFWRPARLSASFHGRDLFAPAAAWLALGRLGGDALHDATITRFADWPDDLPEIVYIDSFGNAMTGLRGALLPATAKLAAGGHRLARARTFSEVPPGTAFWYENSNGLAEIAANGSRADRMLGLSVGTPVAILP
ncbi:MAG: SAM hydrolase/SAM-dependent halogenase family protein [Stellaceae bacterium]